jgi:hypothetical protein
MKQILTAICLLLLVQSFAQRKFKFDLGAIAGAYTKGDEKLLGVHLSTGYTVGNYLSFGPGIEVLRMTEVNEFIYPILLAMRIKVHPEIELIFNPGHTIYKHSLNTVGSGQVGYETTTKGGTYIGTGLSVHVPKTRLYLELKHNYFRFNSETKYYVTNFPLPEIPKHRNANAITLGIGTTL